MNDNISSHKDEFSSEYMSYHFLAFKIGHTYENVNRPVGKMEKGTEGRGSLGNSRKLGRIPSASVISVWLASRSHFPANASYFQFICTFQKLHDTCLVW